MRLLILLAALAACQAGQETRQSAPETRVVHLFEGSQGAFAYTHDIKGANLPKEYQPWKLLKSIARSDPRLQEGVDGEAMREVDAKGYSVAIFGVTSDPPK